MRAQHELVADLLGELGRNRRALRIDHELCDARVVAEVDEDEAAVVAPARHPPGERQLAPDVRRSRLAAHQVAPAHLRTAVRR